MPTPSKSRMASYAYRLMQENSFVISLLDELEKKGQSEEAAKRSMIRLLDRSPTLDQRHSDELIAVFQATDSVTIGYIKRAIDRALTKGQSIHPETVPGAEHSVLMAIVNDVVDQKPFVQAVNSALEAVFDKTYGHSSSHRAHRFAFRVFWQSLQLKTLPSGMPETWNSSNRKKSAA